MLTNWQCSFKYFSTRWCFFGGHVPPFFIICDLNRFRVCACVCVCVRARARASVCVFGNTYKRKQSFKNGTSITILWFQPCHSPFFLSCCKKSFFFTITIALLTTHLYYRKGVLSHNLQGNVDVIVVSWKYMPCVLARLPLSSSVYEKDFVKILVLMKILWRRGCAV